MLGCPLFDAHFLNHAEVVDFQRVRNPFGAVGHGLKPFAGKLIAFEAKFNFFLLHAGIHFTVPVDAKDFESGAEAIVWPATFALEFVFGNVIPFQKSIPVITVFLPDVQRAVETIFATGRC